MLHNILKEAGIPETASLVYEKLLEDGSSSARQLAEKLNIPRPSVYDNLKLLIKDGLVVEQKEENKKIFSIDDVKNLSHIFQSKITRLKDQEHELKNLLPSLAKQARSLEPKIKFYSGAEGIKQVLNNLLWYDNIETLTMWPISEMVDILGKDYLANLNRRRIRQKISIRGIWPQDKTVDFKDHPFLGVGKKHLRELRLAPKNMTWQMSYWLFADKVAFISSPKELFGFVVHSHDFTTLMKTQFEAIWKISKSIKPQPQCTDSFLKTV
jgi:sugar-specific transcriptional regulator TrmB